ncbi:VaFE repeat-containing surface-anchored protein [Candidatus Saccharibacteria bacterium]|nr:VaFE repeat-containing surface-anchored protein [Candidatus Saccharibacteria bacterium]
MLNQTPEAIADSPMVEGVTPSNGLSYGTLTTYIYRINNGMGGAPCWNGGSGCYTSHAMCLQPTKASQVGDYGYISSSATDAVKKIMLVTDAAVNYTIYNAFRTTSGVDPEAIGGAINGGVGAVTYGSGGSYTAGQARAFMVGHILAGAAYTGTINMGYFDGISDSGTTAALNLAYQTIMSWFNSNYSDAPAQFTLNTFTPTDYTHQTLGWLTGSYTPTPQNGSIQLLKYDAATGYNAALSGTGVLAGATFRVYEQSKPGTTLTTVTTSSNGYTPLYTTTAGKTICFVETNPPTGYVLDTTPKCATIVANSTSYVDLANVKQTVYGGVKVRKVDADTNTAAARGTAKVQGTVFTVYNSNSSGTQGSSTGVTLTADASGYATTSSSALAIDPNSGTWYCVKETSAGTGYNLSETSCKPFFLSTSGQIYDLTGSPFKDQVIRGSLKITKQRSLYTSVTHGWTNVPLSGVTFTLVNTADATIAYTSGATDANGNVTINNIIYGTYTVTENRTSTNAAYTLQTFTITISSQGQTVTKNVLNEMPDVPVIDTTARNSDSNPEDKTNVSPEDKEIEVGDAGVTDHITYSGLEPGADYKMEGELWKIETPKELITTKEQDFTAPASGAGSFDLEFDTIDTTQYAGEDLGIIQKLYKENGDEWLLIAEHNLEFENAEEVVTVASYGLSTTATDNADNDHIIEPENAQKINDRVVYQNLVQGRDYILVARLIDKDATKADGQTRVLRINETEVPAIVTKITMPEATEGSTTVRFTIDAREIPGRELVVFERLYEYVEGANASNWETVLTDLVIDHENLEDSNQTVKVRPRIGTQAADEYDNDNKVGAGMAVISDTVSLEGLSKENYKLVGYIVEKKGENGADTEDTPIVAPVGAASATASIRIERNLDLRNASSIPSEMLMEFMFDTRGFAGKKLVIYEELYRIENNGTNTLIAWHKDVNDDKQTIEVMTPKIQTKATDKEDGDKELALNSVVTITDQIDYEGVVPGNKYTLVGELRDKKTGEVIELKDGSTKVIYVFEPAQDRGVELMEFEIDTKELTGKKIVVFEELYIGEWILEEVDEETGDVITPAQELTEDEKIAEHKDLDSANQTVWVKIETPDTGAFSREDDGVKAGQVYIMPVTIVVISLGAIAGYRIYKKRNFGWK